MGNKYACFTGGSIAIPYVIRPRDVSISAYKRETLLAKIEQVNCSDVWRTYYNNILTDICKDSGPNKKTGPSEYHKKLFKMAKSKLKQKIKSSSPNIHFSLDCCPRPTCKHYEYVKFCVNEIIRISQNQKPKK